MRLKEVIRNYFQWLFTNETKVVKKYLDFLLEEGFTCDVDKNNFAHTVCCTRQTLSFLFSYDLVGGKLFVEVIDPSLREDNLEAEGGLSEVLLARSWRMPLRRVGAASEEERRRLVARLHEINVLATKKERLIGTVVAYSNFIKENLADIVAYYSERRNAS